MRHPEAFILCLLLAACGAEVPPVLPGYVEAEYTRIAAPVAGRLVLLQVTKGQALAAGAPLFTLEQGQENAAVAEADAHLARQTATAADLAQGKRQEEIAVFAAQQRQTEAALKLSEAELRRQQSLADQGFLSRAALDSVQTRVRTDVARLEEIRASLKVARLAARAEQRDAAAADVSAARAALRQSEWLRDQKVVSSPAAARVEDTLYRVGEWVPAGNPVVSLLGPEAIKLRFFAPQDRLADFVPGTRLEVSCDGCGAPFAAVVSFVAQSPEFTPPVIYSKESRSQLVFLVEAKPEHGETLRPGQPVDIRRISGS